MFKELNDEISLLPDNTTISYQRCLNQLILLGFLYFLPDSSPHRQNIRFLLPLLLIQDYFLHLILSQRLSLWRQQLNSIYLFHFSSIIPILHINQTCFWRTKQNYLFQLDKFILRILKLKLRQVLKMWWKEDCVKIL